MLLDFVRSGGSRIWNVFLTVFLDTREEAPVRRDALNAQKKIRIS